MIIGVLGASGRTGILVVDELLMRGHKVVCLAFKKPTNINPGIEWIEGDATSKNDLEKVISKSDVIISVLGHNAHTTSDLQTKSMEALTELMSGSDKRLISMTGTGVRQDGDKPSLIDKLLNVAVRIADPARVQDGINHAEVLKRSNTKWTIIRVLKLANGKNVQNTKLTEHGPAITLVNRATVAKHICDLIVDDSQIYKMPIISKP